MDVVSLIGVDIPGEVLFLSLFHVIGGVAIGFTLRGIVDSRENIGSRVFFLIWGGMFGCMPLAFGLDNPATLPVQVGVLLAAIAVPFFWADRLREMFSDQSVLMLGFGGVFLLVGLIAGTLMAREGEWIVALLFGGMFSLVGGGIFIGGLRALLRDTSGDE